MTKRTLRLERWAACALAMAVVLGAATTATAQMNPMMKEQLDRIPTGEAGVKSILDPMTERLSLSAEQIDQVRPIIVEMVSNMESAKAKLESGETTIMKFMMEMNMQGEAAATEVEQHLSEEQLAEYSAMRAEQKLRMQEERRKAMQQMMKARQEAAAAAAEAP